MPEIKIATSCRTFAARSISPGNLLPPHYWSGPHSPGSDGITPVTLTTTPPPASPSPTPTHPAPPADGLRLDIEGLRAIAIGTVLIYHAGAAFLPGGFIGVDIFFVISGFLITGVLIREVEKTTRVSLPRFYARRAKRLFPAAALVLAVTSLVTWLTSSEVHWRTFGG
ncbi:MAG: acyltransferase, partial [Actinomycetota bacterium]|nr:acyltransferase [Actinomycetota bacterium]